MKAWTKSSSLKTCWVTCWLQTSEEVKLAIPCKKQDGQLEMWQSFKISAPLHQTWQQPLRQTVNYTHYIHSHTTITDEQRHSPPRQRHSPPTQSSDRDAHVNTVLDNRDIHTLPAPLGRNSGVPCRNLTTFISMRPLRLVGIPYGENQRSWGSSQFAFQLDCSSARQVKCRRRDSMTTPSAYRKPTKRIQRHCPVQRTMMCHGWNHYSYSLV